MSQHWQYAPLRELLSRSEERVTINPEEKYREITIRLWGKGVTLRREVIGAEIAAGIRFVARKQQFILSRIDARNGAFGLVPDTLDGAIVTNDFPIFNLDASRLLPRFLELFSKTADFADLCKAASEGTTNRIRLKEERFLAATIPLPPLEEQRHIVARIEELAAKIEEARGLRREAIQELSAFCERAFSAAFPPAGEQRVQDYSGFQMCATCQRAWCRAGWEPALHHASCCREESVWCRAGSQPALHHTGRTHLKTAICLIAKRICIQEPLVY